MKISSYSFRRLQSKIDDSRRYIVERVLTIVLLNAIGSLDLFMIMFRPLPLSWKIYFGIVVGIVLVINIFEILEIMRYKKQIKAYKRIIGGEWHSDEELAQEGSDDGSVSAGC